MCHMFDGDPIESGAQSKLDYSQTLAFKNFNIVTNPNQYEFSNIDVLQTEKLIQK